MISPSLYHAPARHAITFFPMPSSSQHNSQNSLKNQWFQPHKKSPFQSEKKSFSTQKSAPENPPRHFLCPKHAWANHIKEEEKGETSFTLQQPESNRRSQGYEPCEVPLLYAAALPRLSSRQREIINPGIIRGRSTIRESNPCFQLGRLMFFH